MTTGPEQDGTWLEDLKDLIRRKQAENVALKRIRDSLQSGKGVAVQTGRPETETKGIPPHADEDLQGVNE